MATRLKLSSNQPASIIPGIIAYAHAQGYQTRRLAPADASPLGNLAIAPDAADHVVAGDTLFGRFVSDPMADGNVFTSGNVFKAAVQAAENNAGDNLQVQWWVGICSQDGETLRATIRSKVSQGVECAVTTPTARFLNSTLSGSYTTVAGDRIVVEVALAGTPVATTGVQGHNGIVRAGGNGAGGFLPESDGSTATNLNPWVEFTTNVVFGGKWKIEAYCPLCGLQLVAKTQPDQELGDPTGHHVHINFDFVNVSCANNHVWLAHALMTLERVS